MMKLLSLFVHNPRKPVVRLVFTVVSWRLVGRIFSSIFIYVGIIQIFEWVRVLLAIFFSRYKLQLFCSLFFEILKEGVEILLWKQLWSLRVLASSGIFRWQFHRFLFIILRLELWDGISSESLIQVDLFFLVGFGQRFKSWLLCWSGKGRHCSMAFEQVRVDHVLLVLENPFLVLFKFFVENVWLNLRLLDSWLIFWGLDSRLVSWGLRLVINSGSLLDRVRVTVVILVSGQGWMFRVLIWLGYFMVIGI